MLTDGPSWFHWEWTKTQHSFPEKVSKNSEAFLQNVCSQINRNWESGEDKIVRTIDRFWLVGCDLLRGAYYYVWAKDAPDKEYGLCEEPEASNRLQVLPGMAGGYGLDGSTYSWRWTRSALNESGDSSRMVLSTITSRGLNRDYSNSAAFGMSPACSIG